MQTTLRILFAAVLCLSSWKAFADCNVGEEEGWDDVAPSEASVTISYELAGAGKLDEGRHCTRSNRWVSEHYLHYDFNSGNIAIAFYYGTLVGNSIWGSMDNWDSFDETVPSWDSQLREAGIQNLVATGEQGVLEDRFGALNYAIWANETTRCLFIMNARRDDETKKIYDGYYCGPDVDSTTIELFPAIIGVSRHPGPTNTLKIGG